MPTYTYSCEVCGTEKDEFRSIAERNNGPECCGEQMQKIITLGYVITDMEPYYDENLETYVKSRQHRNEVMREHGVYDRREFKGHRWKRQRKLNEDMR